MTERLNSIQPKYMMLIITISGLLLVSNINDLTCWVICGSIFIISASLTLFKMITSWSWTKDVLGLSLGYILVLISILVFSSIILGIFILAFMLFVSISD
ncbi:hypothetical protein [Staphylococcus equorum]|uniref:hypothetical protein n=1 Tax=Staphylococcus equorum TaxID=246432 RepID=UPI0025540DA6|nr:hypothetical protein [Staphylococcus equorum]